MGDDSGINHTPSLARTSTIVSRSSLVLGKAKGTIAKVYRVLSRCKPLAGDSTTRLNRVLTMKDLVGISLGASLNMEAYDLPGSVSKNYAGPAVVFSVLIGSVASVIAGLSYAEFSARAPKAGSVYNYTYVCIGEFAAFIIGWGLMLEYVVGAASVAKTLSSYIDEMAGKVVQTKLRSLFPLNCSLLAAAPDFFASGFTLLVTFMHAYGMRQSVKVNTVLTSINVAVIVFVICAGLTKANLKNWQVDPSTVPADVHAGDGGFFPYGFMGVIKGSSVCFFGLNGFEAVSTAGEEASYPHADLPKAIIISVSCVVIIHIAVSIVVPLMLPYYEQSATAPLPHIFSKLGWPAAMFIVHVGISAALLTGLVGMLFPLPRVLYAMAVDGLMLHAFGVVDEKYQTPFVAIFVTGFTTSVVALLFRSDQLQLVLSFGTLFAFTMVAVCALLLRYHNHPARVDDIACFGYSCRDYRKQMLNRARLARPTVLTSSLVRLLVTVYSLLSFGMAAFVAHRLRSILALETRAVLPLLGGFALSLATLWCIYRQPSDKTELDFVLPLVPWLPGLGIPMNLYLMFTMDTDIWLRLTVWYCAGICFYFCYSFRHSIEGKNQAIRLRAKHQSHSPDGRARRVRISEHPAKVTTAPEPQNVGAETAAPALTL